MQEIFNFKTWKNRVFEQETVYTKESKYGVYNFEGVFPDNMITPKPEVYTDIIDKMKSDIEKAMDDGMKLSELNISIESSASAPMATTCLPKDIEEADHNFGDDTLKDKWAHCDSNTRSTHRVENGNKFLAEHRGLKLKEVLINEINNMLKSKDISNKITDDMVELSFKVATAKDHVGDDKNSDDNRYVRAKIEGLLKSKNVEKETKTGPTYHYYIERYSDDGAQKSRKTIFNFKENGKWYMKAASEKIFGDVRKDSTPSEFTNYDAKRTAYSLIKDRSHVVYSSAEKAPATVPRITKDPVGPTEKANNKGAWKGKFAGWLTFVEMKNYSAVSVVPSKRGDFKIIRWWYKDNDVFTAEVKALNRYHGSKPIVITNDQSLQWGAASIGGGKGKRSYTVPSSTPRPSI
jgi:hypothetical protein